DAAESESGLGGSRLAVLCALAAAVALSFGAERSVKDFVLFAWDALGAAFGPAMLFLIFDRRTTARGVFHAIWIGASSVVGWAKVEALTGICHQRIAGFAIASLALVLLRGRKAE
ncbi:MAG: sodium/proline symporter, partial [Planctomycetota bacterium]